MRLLTAASYAELATLTVLLGNLFTAHLPTVSALTGPIHGCAYLFVVIATFQATGTLSARLMSLLPGFGGVIVLRQLARAAQQ